MPHVSHVAWLSHLPCQSHFERRSHICPGVASARRFELHIKTKPCHLAWHNPTYSAANILQPFWLSPLSLPGSTPTLSPCGICMRVKPTLRDMTVQQCSMRVPLYLLHLTIFSFFVTRDLVCHYHVCMYLHAVSHVAINSNLQQKLALPGHDSSPQPPTRSGSHCLCSGSHFPHCPCVASASRRDAANEVTFQQDDTLKAAMLSQLDTACQDLKSQEASRAVSTPTRDGSYIGSH